MVNTTFRKVAFTFWLTALNLAATAHLSAQPTVTVVDSIVLEESGDDYLALPAPVIPDGAGGYLEFVERHPLRTLFQTVVIDSGELWLSGAGQQLPPSAPQYGDRSAIRRWQLGDDEAEPVVGLPEIYEAGGPLGGIFPEMPFAKWADTLLVGFMPLPYLIVTDTEGGELDRFEVPVVRRRGNPDDPEAAIEEVLGGGRYPDVFGLFSLTRGVHRRPDGTFLVVHFDLGTDGPPVSTEALWVSVIDASRTRACPDGLVPLEDGSHPAIGFEGDLLLVLDQVIRGGDAETVVRRIKVETDDCEWVSLSR